MPRGQVNPVVKAITALRGLSPEEFQLAVLLSRPDKAVGAGNGRRRKKPGPKPGFKRNKKEDKQEARASKAGKRIEAEATA